MHSLFDGTRTQQHPDRDEFFQPLLTGPGKLLVERIVSHGHTTPEGVWYDQERDEWVAVLEGEATLLFDGGKEIVLTKGDHVFIPKHARHRVTHTSAPCIWLAVHGDALQPQKV